MSDAQENRANPCADLEAVNAFERDAHEHLSSSILLADQKAGFLFATVTAVLAYLHSTGASQRWLTGLKEGHWGLAETLILLATAGLVVGAVGSLIVVIPRIRGSKKGLVAAWAVASFETPHDYVEAVLQSDPATLARAKLEHVWNLSQINRRKYEVITVALRCSFAGLLAAILYLVLF